MTCYMIQYLSDYQKDEWSFCCDKSRLGPRLFDRYSSAKRVAAQLDYGYYNTDTKSWEPCKTRILEVELIIKK